jgi:hypothetical protein
VGDRYLVCWVQPSQSWDPLGWYGSSFTINFELPATPTMGGSGPRIPRFVGLLSAGDREIIRAAQNVVIGRLPPAPWPLVRQLPEGQRASYLAHGDPVTAPYTAGQDVWLRHGDLHDLDNWFPLVEELLPSALEQAAIRFEI